MIIYFSGTGNSRFIAKKLGEELGEKVFSASEDLRENKKGYFPYEQRLIFVSPTYMSRMPPIFEKYIRESKFDGCKNAYFIFSAAEAVGKAAKYCRKLCVEKGLIYSGTAAIKSPANYVVMYDVSPKIEAKKEMAKSEYDIQKLAQQIYSCEKLTVDAAFNKHNSFSAFAHMIMKFTSAKGFHTNSDCISCGACAKVCPLGNIKLENGHPVWGKNCTHCMGCISVCPKKAIDYGKKTQDRNRYYLP